MDWINLLSTRFPEELTTHLKMFKQSRVRLKHVELMNAKESANDTAKLSPKRDEKKTHRRNKSETDLSWLPGKNIHLIGYLDTVNLFYRITTTSEWKWKKKVIRVYYFPI